MRYSKDQLDSKEAELVNMIDDAINKNKNVIIFNRKFNNNIIILFNIISQIKPLIRNFKKKIQILPMYMSSVSKNSILKILMENSQALMLLPCHLLLTQKN